MKVAPISADLLLKLALLAGAVGLAIYVLRRTTGAVGDAVSGALDGVAAAADSVIVGVNPYNPGNWVNQGVSAVGSAAVSDTGPGRNADGSWSLGGWIYDVTHTDAFNPAANVSSSWSGDGAIAHWGIDGRRTASPTYSPYGTDAPAFTGGASGTW